MSNRKYEAFYIVKPDLADADVQKIADNVNGLDRPKDDGGESGPRASSAGRPAASVAPSAEEFDPFADN